MDVLYIVLRLFEAEVCYFSWLVPCRAKWTMGH